MSSDQTTPAQPQGCRWCGATWHGLHCPSVRAIEFFQDGVTVKRVEFHGPQPITAGPALKPWDRIGSGVVHSTGQVGRNAYDGPESCRQNGR